MLWKSIRFELLELLGEGSQGRVYKALRSDSSSGLQQIVAVKVLHSKTAVSLWRQEFESLARVRSPYCVQVLSFERFGRRPSLVLEYVEGVTLTQLGQSCCLNEEGIQEMIAQIECALKDLHRQNVFHGDLSPQNILVDTSGRIRVLDFGLANSSEGHSRATLRYAAPERLNEGRSSAATDLFSLGQIEVFLRGHDLTPSHYLYVTPEHRRFQDLSPSAVAQKHVADKVMMLLSRQKKTSASKTQTLVQKGQKTWSAKAFVLLGITSLLIFASSRQGTISKPMAALIVRTKHWHYLLLNGKPLGYSPISLPLEAGHAYRLEWISAKNRGARAISLQPLEMRTLEDSDFLH